MSRILLAGPWIGEFGWELFCWQGFVRKLSMEYDKTIVIGRPGNEVLYEDFCDEYIEFDPKGWETDGWRCYDCKKNNYFKETIKHTKYLSGEFDIGYLSERKSRFFNEQIFYKFESNTSNQQFDIIFHCRNKTTGSDRNWSVFQWQELYGLLSKDLKVACIGNDEAFYIEGTTDLRGATLNCVASVMSNSQLIVGPSSGPMHLASLCGLKHIVWSSTYNSKRYKEDWNPFNTEVVFYDLEDWNPKPSSIYNLILDHI